MAGRPRIPPEMHKTKGTLRKDRQPGNPVKPRYISDIKDCKPPSHLPKVAKSYFVGLVGDLLDLKVLSHELLGTVEAVAIQGWLRDELIATLESGELESKERIDILGKITSANKTLFDMRRQMSLTPSTRASISVEKDKAKDEAVSQFLPPAN